MNNNNKLEWNEIRNIDFKITRFNLPENRKIEILYAMNGMSEFGLDTDNEFRDNTLFRNYEEVASRIEYLKIKNGDVFFDIGASCGSWSIPAAMQGARVFAFEPGPQQINTLVFNLHINNISSQVVKIYNIVLSAEITDLMLNRMKVVPKNTTHDAECKCVRVKADTLDNWINKHRDEECIKHIDYIKIDVEGMEFEVLRGAYYTLREFKPKLIIEIHEAESPHLRYDIKSLLVKDLGYKHKYKFPLHDFFY